MKLSRASVQHWLELHPQFRKRSLMYEATADYLGITPDQVEKAITFHRRLQNILPNDKKGVELQKEWLANEGMEDIVSLAIKALTPPGYVRRDGHLYKII